MMRGLLRADPNQEPVSGVREAYAAPLITTMSFFADEALALALLRGDRALVRSVRYKVRR
jgi:hypothetical protein